MKRSLWMLVFFGMVLHLASAGGGWAAGPISVAGDGYLEELDGLPVLHLKGSNHEMGVQYGTLLGPRIAESIAMIEDLARKTKKASSIPRWMIAPIRRAVGWIFWRQFPASAKQQILGMIEGAGRLSPPVKLSKYDIAFVNSIIDLVGILKPYANLVDIDPSRGWALELLGLDGLRNNCDSLAVWGWRTVGGKTFQTRNVDISTGLGLERFPLVVVYKPEGGVPYLSAAFVGSAGVFTGMNAHGVALGQIWAFSKVTGVGTPWQIMMKDVFAQATSATEAVELYRHAGIRTYGSNFVFASPRGSDGGEGYAVESTPVDFEVFTSNDPKEDRALWQGEPYGIRLENAVFRGDAALSPKIRAYQTASNGPDGDPRAAGAYQKRYKGQSDRIAAFAEAGIRIGKEEAETISRETAIRGESLQATVYANTDRHLWVSYAWVKEDGTIGQAYEGVYRHIPFADYLPTLELDRERGLVVSDHFGSGRARGELEIRVRRGTATFPYSPSEVLAGGDVAELRYLADGRLADRLVIRR